MLPSSNQPRIIFLQVIERSREFHPCMVLMRL